MNKKFLSAILFGALMVTSTGHLCLVRTMMMTLTASTRTGQSQGNHCKS